jgi:hypothetical protein
VVPQPPIWADTIIDSATRDKIAGHFETIKSRRIAGKPATLAEVLQGPPTPLAGATGKRKNQGREKGGPKKDRRSLLKPMFLMSVLHPFAVHLKDWEKGVPVDCGAPWTNEAITLAVARGAHPTARTRDAIELVHEDVEYQVQAGFSQVVLWDDIRHDLHPNFKISPVAVVPQPNRRGRIILDLSFPVRRQNKTSRRRHRMGEIIQRSVNDTTDRLAPSEAVKAIGQVLPNLFQFMADTPSEEVIVFSKIDLSNGFWRMIVEEDSKWNFCYVMPDPEGSPVRIVVPSALQMGWAESPPYFCAATQAGRDVIEYLIDEKFDLPPHPLESYIIPEEALAAIPPSQQPATHRFVAVYVDDFILAGVESQDGTLLRRMARAALLGIHSIFPPTEVTGHKGGKDPISQKKLDKGDATMAATKEILGFLVEGEQRTVQLPATKATTICEEMKKLLKRKNIPFKRLEKIVGKLIHACTILPTSKALLTPLYRSMAARPSIIGLGKDSEVRAALMDLRAMIQSIATRPTHVYELVERRPSFIGMVDASSTGVGGIWLLPNWPPIVYRQQWPDHINKRYREAKITNSDLELAGVLVAWFILESCTCTLRHAAATIFSDNSPTVSWTQSLMSRSEQPTSARLLRALAMRARSLESQVPTVLHWAGKNNRPADAASRSFDPKDPHFSPNDTDFLTLFHASFPLSQDACWLLRPVPPTPLSRLISTLDGQRLPMRQWTYQPDYGTGATGRHIVPTKVTPTPTSLTAAPLSAVPCWWDLLPDIVQVTLAAAIKFKEVQWPQQSDMSDICSTWQDTPTPESS